MILPPGSHSPTPAPENNQESHPEFINEDAPVTTKDTLWNADSLETDMSIPALHIQAVTLFQTNNPNSPIAVDIPHQTIPPALSSQSPFILELTFELTAGGQQQLTQQTDAPILCQIQVFAKPLSPIRGTHRWREALSLPLSPTQKSYTTRLTPVLLGAGLYSLQVLLLIHRLPSSPMLLEIPVFQVN
ncbi:MAG: hypothetical protein F6J95_007855 [Leptolyngbya sp. SIO1E4]|nr:hypothetical protein [Leptolyngbya sp. SIO1E4]